MIRPLEYCETVSHVNASIDTIDHRILELIALRETFIRKRKELAESSRTELGANIPPTSATLYGPSTPLIYAQAERQFRDILEKQLKDQQHDSHEQ